jgi:uncharacterized surface protein with fasciclin (FAS1) repeats
MKTTMILLQRLFFLLFFITHLVCGENSIFDIIVLEKKLTSFTSQLERLNMTHYMKELNNVTVFAPVDRAFEHDESLTVDQLLYHIIRPHYTTHELGDGMLLKTDANQRIKVSSKDDMFIGNAKIIKDGNDIKATNGYIHMIDSVLTLPLNLGNLKNMKEKKKS